MISLPITLILTFLTLLTTSVTALPTSPNREAASISVATTEKWSIPSLKMHMMTRFTGLPGNSPWPESTKYPSTIDFDINMPNYQTVHCHAEFMNSTLPDGLESCYGEGENVKFMMKEYTALGQRRKELSFILQVFREEGGPGKQTIFTGEVAITANDPKEPSSYLTCLLGAPFDGLRCKTGGMMSVRKELIIEATTSDKTSEDEHTSKS